MSDAQSNYVNGEFNTEHHTTSEPYVLAQKHHLAFTHVTVVDVHKYFKRKNEKQLCML